MDPVRVWFTGLLMIAVGVFFIMALFFDKGDEKGESFPEEHR